MSSAASPSIGTRHHHNVAGISCRIAAMVGLATLSAAVKWAGQHGVPLLEVIFFRNAFAFIPLGLFIFRTTSLSALKTRRPRAHLIRSGIGVGGMLLTFASVTRLPLSEATALQFTAPLFMTALSALVLKETVGWHRWTAVAVGFLGILIMVHPQASHLDRVGVALALGAAMFVAAAMVAVRQLTASEAPAAVVFYFTLTGTIVGLVGSIGNWVMPDPISLAALVAAGVIGGVTQILLTESLRLAALGVVAPFDYSQLVWAALLGYTFWGEFPDAYTILGAVIVATSGLYILHRELRRLRMTPR